MNNNPIFDPEKDIIDSLSTINTRVHIRIKQRNGKKSTTSIEHLPKFVDLGAILREMKRKFNCNGSVQECEDDKFIQLFGDQRIVAKNYLVHHNIIGEQDIVIHGY